ncbi:MAG: hypothetical protein QXD57_07085 [Ignisphaera sp.]
MSSLLMSMIDAVYETVSRGNVSVRPYSISYIDEVVNSILLGLLVHIKMDSLDPNLSVIVDSPRAQVTVNVWSLVYAGVVQSNPLGAYVTKYDPDELEVAVILAPSVPMYVDSAKLGVYSSTSCSVLTYIRTSYRVPPNAVQTILNLVGYFTIERIVEITKLETKEIIERERIVEIARPEEKKKEEIIRKARTRLDPEARL